MLHRLCEFVCTCNICVNAPLFHLLCNSVLTAQIPWDMDMCWRMCMRLLIASVSSHTESEQIYVSAAKVFSLVIVLNGFVRFLKTEIFCKAFAHYCLSKGLHQIRLSESFEIVVVRGEKQRRNFQNFTVIFNILYFNIEFIFALDHHFENIEPYTSCFIIHNKKKAIIINIIDYTISSNPA